LTGFIIQHSEKNGAGLVSKIIGTKTKLGLGVGIGIKNNRNVNTIWSSQLADELHKPVVKKFLKRKVFVNGIDKIWTADLVEMQQFSEFSREVRYLLTAINVFSKYGWMLPLKDKTVKSVADAFKKIFKISKRKPEKLWTDKGCEFYNEHVRELGVELYSTENEEKSSVAEHWNRTMKERMYKYFTANKLVLAL